MPLNNLKQALDAAGRGDRAEPARHGARLPRRAHGDRHVVVLPGVPREMKPMVEDTVLPWLRALRGGDVYLARTFQTFGVTESGLDELVAGVVDPGRGPRVVPRELPRGVGARRRARRRPATAEGAAGGVGAARCASASARASTARAR